MDYPALPTAGELKKAYARLQRGEHVVSIRDFSQWVLWTRLDPRLLEILLRYLSAHFLEFDFFKLRLALVQCRALSVFCVLLDLADLSNLRDTFDKEKKGNWKLWKSLMQKDVEKEPFQSFFVGLHAMKPQFHREQIKKNAQPFKKWNFYSADLPLSQKLRHGSKTKTLRDSAQRIPMLKKLLKEKKQITVNDYIEALGSTVSRRTAERDLESLPGIQKKGFTRGRIYSV